MSRRLRLWAGALAAFLVAGGLTAIAGTAEASVGTGPWTSISPSFTTQEKGCGSISGLTFKLTCSTASGEQRAERRYATYSGGTRQFEGYFKINSMSGTRISLKQTFNQDNGPYFLLAVERGGRMYNVEGGATLGTGATVGTSVRVNTIHVVGSNLKIYINGSLKQTVSSPSGNFYDKFGTYRTSSGAGPISVTWSNIKFYQK
jgi:hypothetical protein